MPQGQFHPEAFFEFYNLFVFGIVIFGTLYGYCGPHSLIPSFFLPKCEIVSKNHRHFNAIDEHIHDSNEHPLAWTKWMLV